MRFRPIALLAALASCAAPAPPSHLPAPPIVTTPSTPSIYPATRRVDAKDVLHGVTVRDPYRWLEDGNSAEVKEWAKAQDALTQSKLAAIPALAEFHARLKELLFAGDIRPPRRAGSRYFYERRDPGREKFAIYVRDVKSGAERVLVDPSTWPAEESWTLQDYAPSPDGRKIVYRVSKNNADLSILRVRDVESGEDSSIDVVAPVRLAFVSWSADSRGFYYRREPSDPNLSASEGHAHVSIRYHRLETDPKSDIVARAPTGNPQSYERPIASQDGKWLFVEDELTETRTDVHFATRQGNPRLGCRSSSGETSGTKSWPTRACST